MPRSTVLLCMGTRPEIIKMAPVYHALRGGPLTPVVLHTGQHDSIAWPLYQFFGMEPDRVLDLTRERPSLGHLNAQLLDALDGVLDAENAEAVLVHGDTSSALSAAMAAFYAGAPVGHVEAGLRSGNPTDPFPEEMNRTVIARLATWHFAPTHRAVRNLVREGVRPESISLVGNTVVDAVHHGLGVIGSGSWVPSGLPADTAEWTRSGRLALVTMHRRENWGRPIEEVAAAIAEAVLATPDLRVLWPVHPNPAVGAAVQAGLDRAGLSAAARARIRLVEPLDYPAMLWALRRSWLVLTDSGGIQEEAAALDRPVLVLRQTTERPELIEAGGGVLVGASGDAVRGWLRDLTTRPDAYAALRCETNPYGDGTAGEQIAATLADEVAHRATTGMPRIPAPSAPHVGPLPPAPVVLSVLAA
ncbi:non-hydrolyzing UDP-N-acetylglucosamine 2-epimerase [Rubrivirga sp. SAORIC476]|uniref:non-hydrolyzing UDP-N-acetylglucosamine 2-epimerase n=1 Tax=Rubrivirga sp. SAORIC476 TaxID=1961794 RepID=UPI000BA98155|nr:UDP-N-acetylglucosamine 2-epimerase (non-hydrolyzing) [Rubrivirga sp. SAORIC476]